MTVPGAHAGARPPRPDEETAEDSLVRPFLLTGGRTTTHRRELRVESLITAVPAPDLSGQRFEARRIVELTRRPTSVAEVAVALGVPIGVVRVLVGDLLDSGLVTVVQVEQISSALLERIRDRVRAL